MTLNCKTGDLAYVAKQFPIFNKARQVIGKCDSIGAVVRCVTLTRAFDGSALWEFDQDVPVVLEFDNGARERGRIFGLADEYLRSLGNPGDDAVDETIRLIGRPQMMVTK